MSGLNMNYQGTDLSIDLVEFLNQMEEVAKLSSNAEMMAKQLKTILVKHGVLSRSVEVGMIVTLRNPTTVDEAGQYKVITIWNDFAFVECSDRTCQSFKTSALINKEDWDNRHARS